MESVQAPESVSVPSAFVAEHGVEVTPNTQPVERHEFEYETRGNVSGMQESGDQVVGSECTGGTGANQ